MRDPSSGDTAGALSEGSLDPLDDRDKDDEEKELEAESKQVGSMTDDLSSLTDAERGKQCAKWMIAHEVNIGQSWGTLPEALQHKWLVLHCDYYLQKDAFLMESGRSEGEGEGRGAGESEHSHPEIIFGNN